MRSVTMRLRLDEALDTIIDDRTKGVPGSSRPVALRDLGSLGWNVLAEDLPLPLLVLKRRALQSNLAVMRDYCARHDVALAPHGKTTMAPQLFDEQLRMGAWGMTAATVQQLQVYRHFGVDRIMYASQLVGAPGLRYLAGELTRYPDFELFTWVDSPESVELLADAARRWRPPRTFGVLVEVGYAGGRAGIRTQRQMDEVLRAIDRHSSVDLVGVAGFEGLLDAEPFAGHPPVDPGALTPQRYLQQVASAVESLLAAGVLPDEYILTAGGSASFDAVVATFDQFIGSKATVLLRSGCYITHDHLMNARTSPLSLGNSAEATASMHLEPALELWTQVQSAPEDDLAILTFGRRDAPFDYGLPIPLRRYPAGSQQPVALPGASVQALNDQHAYLRGAGDVHVGDRIVLGISHPCTAFDKWRLIPVVDDDYTVVDGILTYF
jgi:D-serine dehydratase